VGSHFSIDETKAKGYVVVAVVCPDTSLSTARRTVSRLVLRGQRSVHMKNESPRRRRQIASAISDLRSVDVRAIVIDAGRGPEPEHVRRDRALRAIVERAARDPAPKLVLDLDHTLTARDARAIAAAVRESDVESISYMHQRLTAEPLLSMPDVVAWCWARSGEWRQRVSPLIAEAVRL
jgi:hypothetical protein